MKAVKIHLSWGKGPSAIIQVRKLVGSYIRKLKKGQEVTFEDGVLLEDLVEWLFDKNHPNIARWVSQMAAFWDYVTLEKLEGLMRALKKRRMQHKARKQAMKVQ